MTHLDRETSLRSVAGTRPSCLSLAACPEGQFVRYVFTDDTRLARPELLEEVERVCRPWTCDRRWDKRKHKHARGDNVTVAVAVSTVAEVVRQLIRGNAVAHVVFVPWCDRKPRKGRPRGRVLTDVTRIAWRKGDRVRHQDDSLPSVQPVHAPGPTTCRSRRTGRAPSEYRCVALQCTARQERQRRGTITIGNPVHRAFEPTATYLQRGSQLLLPFYPRLF